MKIKIPTTIVTVLAIIVALSSCKKDETPTTTDTGCNVKGNYSGTYTNQFGQTGILAYILGDDNFIKGASTLAATPTAFGGYSNTCDSLKMQSYNTINSSYYSFAGKFSANRNSVTGIYKNLTTTSEVGTFTLTKQ